jgi:hypothetical protein
MEANPAAKSSPEGENLPQEEVSSDNVVNQTTEEQSDKAPDKGVEVTTSDLEEAGSDGDNETTPKKSDADDALLDKHRSAMLLAAGKSQPVDLSQVALILNQTQRKIQSPSLEIIKSLESTASIFALGRIFLTCSINLLNHWNQIRLLSVAEPEPRGAASFWWSLQ